MKNTKNFASRWGFILASVGSAVGMANVWGFPNKLGSNGGGAFLLIYLLFVFIFSYVGLPAEFAMGRHAATGTLGAYEKAWSTRGKGRRQGRRPSWLAAARGLAVHCVRLCGHRHVHLKGAGGFARRHADDGGHRVVVRHVLLHTVFRHSVPHHRGRGDAADALFGRAQHRKKPTRS